MAISQNGWSVLFSAPSAVSQWITGRTRPGDAKTVLDYVAKRFNDEVEKINKASSWGWNVRAIRGQTTGYSNHASGTAYDLNAPQHPLGKVGTFSSKQVAAIHKILADVDHVVRWGGDYNGRKDEMHFEINANAAAVKTVAAKISKGTVTPPAWKPNPTTKSTLAIIQQQFQIAAGLRKGKIARYNGVGLIQQKLGGLTVDGYCGPATVAKWKQFEASHKGTGRQTTPDPTSLKALGIGGNFVGPEAK